MGESHGPAIGCVVDGCPPNINIKEKDIQAELNKRKPGQSKFTTQRKEDDKVEILSGIFDGKTTGTPISMIIYNKDMRSRDYETIKKFPYKEANVLTPLKLGRYFTKNKFKKVKEMDWYDQTIINDLKITFVPAVHWSKRTLTDTNKTLWGSFLIEYKNKKIFFACDTGYGNIYKELGEKYGPIDLTFINIGA